jgi:PKD repeat protein
MKRVLAILIILSFIGIVSATSYTSRYPDSYSTLTVKTTSIVAGGYEGYLSVDPSNSLTGTQVDNQWVSGSPTNQRFHIDLNATGAIIRRVYYENSHFAGVTTESGVKTFTMWGSNTTGSFDTLTYANDTGWTLLTTEVSVFDIHVSANQADPKYFTVSNAQPYRYYAFKFVDSQGSASYNGIRRLTLQTEDGYAPGVVYPEPSFISNATSGFSPLHVQFNDTSITTPTAWNWSYQGISGGNTTQTWWSQIQNTTGIFTTGNYTIKLNITNASGYNTSTDDYWVNVSAPTITAAFSGTPLSGVAGTNVAFTDASTGYAADNWTWDFGDSSPANTTQNPSHTYAANGNYNVNLTVYNSSAGFDSELKSGYITISDSGGLSGWNRQDIMMDQIFTLTLNIKDASTFNGIPGAVIQTSNGDNTTTDLFGVATFSMNYTAIVVQVGATGYYSRTISYVVDRDRDETIYLTAVAASGNNTVSTWFIPRTVTLVCTDFWNNPIPGLTISATPQNFTAPEGWLETYYGVPGSVSINGTTLSGTSGTDGSWAAPMAAALLYQFSFTGSGITPYTETFYPSSDQYYIRIPTAGVFIVPTPAANYITYTLANITIDSTHEFFNVTYQDTSGGTANITLNVSHQNGTVLYSDTVSGFGTAATTISSGSLVHQAGDTYTYSIKAPQSQLGSVNQVKTITWENLKTLSGYPDWVGHWMGIALLVVLAGVFSFISVKFALVIIPVMTYFMTFYMRWIDPTIGLTTMIGFTAVVGAIFTIGVLKYMREQQKKLG